MGLRGGIAEEMPGKTNKSLPIDRNRREQMSLSGERIPEFWYHSQEGPLHSCPLPNLWAGYSYHMGGMPYYAGGYSDTA